MNVLKLVEDVLNIYTQLSNLWIVTHKKLLNQRAIQVRDIEINSDIYNYILEYRDFITQNYDKIQQLKYFKKIRCRVKNPNSIESKITGYISTSKHEYGKIQFNKCFNDIFGLRCVSNTHFDLNIIKELIKNSKYSKNVKVVDGSHPDYGYKAIHLYFTLSNFTFRWELQLWNTEDEKNNIEMHNKYKQHYITLENEYNTEEKKKLKRS